ncbi:MAG: flagellar type III secretion system pore protein FliP [Hyphomonadaceae bacterium]
MSGEPKQTAPCKRPRWVRLILFASLTMAAISGATAAYAAAAPTLNIDLGSGEGLTARVLQLAALITVRSLAPSIRIMTTSFVRIVVVLSLLRTAIGLQQAPPNVVIVSLSLFLTAFVMQPVWNDAYQAGIGPVMQEEMPLDEAFPRIVAPLKRFMASQAREQDIMLFIDMARMETPPATAEDTPLRVLAPAFMVSELRRAFEIGFMLFVPFVIIDLVVASLLMAMGMMMMPPVTVSLPFKLIFFVLVDGWRLVAGSLIESFSSGAPPGG